MINPNSYLLNMILGKLFYDYLQLFSGASKMFHVRTQLVSKIKLIDFFPPALCAFSLPFSTVSHTAARCCYFISFFLRRYISFHFFRAFDVCIGVERKRSTIDRGVLELFLYQSQNHEIGHFNFIQHILYHESFNN